MLKSSTLHNSIFLVPCSLFSNHNLPLQQSLRFSTKAFLFIQMNCVIANCPPAGGFDPFPYSKAFVFQRRLFYWKKNIEQACLSADREQGILNKERRFLSERYFEIRYSLFLVQYSLCTDLINRLRKKFLPRH